MNKNFSVKYHQVKKENFCSILKAKEVELLLSLMWRQNLLGFTSYQWYLNVHSSVSPLFLLYRLKAYRIKYLYCCYKSDNASKGLIPKLKVSLWELDLNLPSSPRRVNQEEQCEEYGVVSTFISFLRPVEVSAILHVLPLSVSHKTNFGSTSPVQLL